MKSKFKKFYGEHEKYVEPTLIRFVKPVKIKLSELGEFLDSYRPFPCADVWAYGEFEYGDFDNHVRAVYESIAVDPKYSKVFRKKSGIYKAGQTNFSIIDHFWYYRENYPFWKECPSVGYNDSYKGYRYIDKVEIELNGVYIISWSDKTKIENGGQN